MYNTYKIVKTIPAEIFRAYDIRGIVDESFTTDNIYTIGLAIGSSAIEKGKNVLVLGRDGRLSGPKLLSALQAGVLASGCDVINIGEVTTPVLYYATSNIESDSGIMLTGSHNPPNYNGLKIVIAGDTLYGEEIQKLYKRILDHGFKFGKGTSKQKLITDSYIKCITDDVKLSKSLTVVIDCGNGIGGKVAPKLFKELNCNVHELYCEVDGNFPNHPADPSVPDNLKDIISYLKSNEADIGLAFDGDADRVGIVTEKGEIIAADRLIMFLAIDFLTRHKNMTIPFDVKCSRHLADQIKKHGGVPLMYKTGHSLLKAKMKELGTMIAGEFSGHIFIKERWFGFDDGIYVASRFLELLSKSNKTCSELFSDIPNSINTPELKIYIAEDKKFKFMDQLVSKANFPNGIITTIDGIRVDYPDGFGLVRTSNTSPCLTARFEGDSTESLERIKTEFREQLLSIDNALHLSF